MVAHILSRPIIAGSAIALVVMLAGTGTKAQDTKSAQSNAPAVASADGTQPFLFDGRMRGDGLRQGAISDDHHPDGNAVVMPPKDSPARDR